MSTFDRIKSTLYRYRLAIGASGMMVAAAACQNPVTCHAGTAGCWW